MSKHAFGGLWVNDLLHVTQDTDRWFMCRGSHPIALSWTIKSRCTWFRLYLIFIRALIYHWSLLYPTALYWTKNFHDFYCTNQEKKPIPMYDPRIKMRNWFWNTIVFKLQELVKDFEWVMKIVAFCIRANK